MQNSKAVVLWWILESVSLEASVFTGAPTVSYILDINLLICLVLVHVSDGGSIYIYIYTQILLIWTAAYSQLKQHLSSSTVLGTAKILHRTLKLQSTQDYMCVSVIFYVWMCV